MVFAYRSQSENDKYLDGRSKNDNDFLGSTNDKCLDVRSKNDNDLDRGSWRPQIHIYIR